MTDTDTTTPTACGVTTMTTEQMLRELDMEGATAPDHQADLAADGDDPLPGGSMKWSVDGDRLTINFTPHGADTSLLSTATWRLTLLHEDIHPVDCQEPF